LRRPNHYQNRIKFIEQWIVSKLLHGSTYVLKEKDARGGIVTGLYILDANRVSVLVADNGEVFYELKTDTLSGITKEVTVPASEIIHDMMVSLWHPLIGVSPIYAAAMSATQGRRIQTNSSSFFNNMSRPSGMLTAPGTISDDTANRLKKEWETNFSGNNIGRLAVLGDALKYEAMTIPAQQAQLIEQLEWTARDIAACFHMPLFKVGGPVPANHTIEALNLQYYSDCLQSLIEQFELCLDEGLRLPAGYSVELDTDQLARMDTAAQIEALNKSVAGGWMAPNEARKARNLRPVVGGDSPMIQQQNYSLAALAKRDAKEEPFA
jgi:HK97 family phage portal protein